MAFLNRKPKNIDFNTDKVGRLLFRLSLPPITVAIITSIVNFFSGAIVANVSIDYLTAYTICSPFCIALVTSMYIGVTNGSASLAGRNITNKDTVNKVIFNSMLLLSFFMLIYVFIAIVFAKPFLRLYTSNETIIRIGIKFIYIYSIASIITGYSQTLIGILQALGDTVATSIFSLASIPLTFSLNYITVNGYLGVPKMGLYGIAVTAIFISLLNLGFGTIRLKVRGYSIFKNREISLHFVWQLFTIALPTMLQQFLATTLVSGYNLVIKGISESAVAVMGIFYNWVSVVQATRLQFSIFSVIGSNLSANRNDRIRKAILCSVFYTVIVSSLFTLVLEIFSEICLKTFNFPIEEMHIGVKIFRILSIYILPMMLFAILGNIAIALGDARLGFIALVVQASFTLIGGTLLNKISETLSIVAFPAAAYFALLAVILMIYKNNSPQIKILKEAFKS